MTTKKFSDVYEVQKVQEVKLFDKGYFDVGTGEFVSKQQRVITEDYVDDQYNILLIDTETYVGVEERKHRQFSFSLEEIKNLIDLFNATGKFLLKGQKLDYMTSPLVKFNQDEHTRNMLLFDVEELNYQFGALDFGTDGHIRPEGVDLETLEKLVNSKFVDIYEQLNDRPTIFDLLKFMRKYNGFVLGGIATSSYVSFDSIRATGDVSDKARKAFNRFKRDADSFDDDSLYAWFD